MNEHFLSKSEEDICEYIANSTLTTIKYQPLYKILTYGLYPITDGDRIKYVCNLCSKKFVSLDSILYHILKHHSDGILPDILPYDE
jgi:hypothetical protein